MSFTKNGFSFKNKFVDDNEKKCININIDNYILFIYIFLKNKSNLDNCDIQNLKINL